ncbi:MAG TPA: PIG-L family deacetylase [Chloroflexi bacterium]|nr:PIG-L family deacetylase [Chloroflexota bacterium]
MKMHNERVLVLAAHPDDGELGCGGTLVKLIERGAEVYYVAFSICEESVPEGFPRDILVTELRAACGSLNIPIDHLTILRYPVRHFPQYRQEILEYLVQIRRELQPSLVLLPAPTDVHQDHQIVCQEGIRAFKHVSILGYELPWNNLTFTASAFVHLEERHLEEKLRALRHYRSQRHRKYWREDLIRGLARVRGAQAGVDYAEAFHVVRWVIP